jgi:hypothetical protein
MAVVDGVMIATPAFGGQITTAYFHGALRTQQELLSRGVTYDWVTTNSEPLIQRARNNLAARFLAWRRGTHLVFIDADIGWQPGDLFRLLEHDEPVVCAPYPKKKYPIEFSFRALFDEQGRSVVHPRTGAVEIAAAATGFVCIKRKAFELLEPVCPRIEHEAEVEPEHLSHLRNFFPVEVEDGVLWGEDFGFSRRWRSVGGRIWLDPTIHLTHVGAHAFQEELPSSFVSPSS